MEVFVPFAIGPGEQVPLFALTAAVASDSQRTA
jgi:hypothetical protein